MIRLYLGVSQGKLATLLKLNKSAVRVSEYEAGLREPNLIVLLRYARLVNVSTDVLIDDSLGLSEQLYRIENESERSTSPRGQTYF